MRYEVTIQPGCHGRPYNPVQSRHGSLDAAVRAARKSDRLQVEDSESGRVLYRTPRRNHPRYGEGRFGQGPLHTEPGLAECIRHAAAAEAMRQGV